jgi:hypothetical protein
LSGGAPSGTKALDLQLDDNTRRIIGDGMAGETIEQFGTCWDGTVTNPSNPARRDVAQLQANSYIVLQWNQDNPGIWPLHCHIAWHLSAGFVWTVLERPDDIVNNLNIPDVMSQTCDNWNTWSKTNRVSPLITPMNFYC